MILKNEVAKQFNEIWRRHHNPDDRERAKIVRYREKRKKQIKDDVGL